MITEISIKEIGDVYAPDAMFVICSEVPSDFVWLDNYKKCPILIPKYEKDYRIGLINIDDFENRYRIQLKSPLVKEYILYLKSLENSVYLVTNVDYGFLSRSI